MLATATSVDGMSITFHVDKVLSGSDVAPELSVLNDYSMPSGSRRLPLFWKAKSGQQYVLQYHDAIPYTGLVRTMVNDALLGSFPVSGPDAPWLTDWNAYYSWLSDPDPWSGVKSAGKSLEDETASLRRRESATDAIVIMTTDPTAKARPDATQLAALKDEILLNALSTAGLSFDLRYRVMWGFTDVLYRPDPVAPDSSAARFLQYLMEVARSNPNDELVYDAGSLLTIPLMQMYYRPYEAHYWPDILKVLETRLASDSANKDTASDMPLIMANLTLAHRRHKWEIVNIPVVERSVPPPGADDLTQRLLAAARE
jgi:hypothetical protein